ncbi:hypothetical protein [Flavobacterium sp.]|uniref:hypothetical protein n=1 Tax=Flavobacterium sp. TaxID=239 RepID=UPI0012140C5D|nr:hypothetical protein [Flavobacterium sp.]RZJ70743.1 MAG: hypothetical protein EOO49_12890 [Flavobacterium sp.]
MKTFFKIGCGAIVLLLAVAYGFYYYETGGSKPSQSIKFLNTGKDERSVTFEMVGKDGKLLDGYYANSKVKPNDFKIEEVQAGNYKIRIWDAADNLVKEMDFKLTLPDPNKSNYELLRFDLAQDKVFVIVNMNSLYKGNDIAEHMSKAMGTQRSGLTIAKAYDGQKPFMLDPNITMRNVVDLEDDFPDRVSYGNTVYAIFAVPRSLPEGQLDANLMEQISKKTE